MPQREDVDLFAPGIRRELYGLPHASLGPQVRLVLDVPLHCIVGIQASVVDIVRKLPQRALKPLRLDMRLVPYSKHALEERDVHASAHPWRGAYVQELLVYQVPPERVLKLQLFELPRLAHQPE